MTDVAYSNISDILARKSEGRRALQKLSMADKIMRIEALRDRLSPFKAARENRSAMAGKDVVTACP